jgi:diaminopimelate decarboxylase
MKSEFLKYYNKRLHLEDIDLGEIAGEVGTPCYVYSRRSFEQAWHQYNSAFKERAHRICYAVKANDNLSILKALALIGSDFDVVSIGELHKVTAAGGNPAGVVFSGVGKTRGEITDALKAGIGCINLESCEEFERLESVAASLGACVNVAVRVNPNVDPKTHPYISTGLKDSKFGVPIDDARELYQRISASKWLNPSGIACHIGSQITSVDPIIEAVRHVVDLALGLKVIGIKITNIDVGGGLGIDYAGETPPTINELVDGLCQTVPEEFKLVLEPGRSIVGPAGLMLTRVEFIKKTKDKNFVIVDAGMNDLLRPALYDGWHDVLTHCENLSGVEGEICDVVGPICETGDTLAKNRRLLVSEGDLLAVVDCGAYGAVMGSNYNARLRCAEVLVDESSYSVVRRRQTFDSLISDEKDVLIT